jgi:hypothetical protein
VVPSPEGNSSKIKVKLRMDVHGIFTVSGAQLVEKVLSDPEPEPMETAPETQKKEEQVDGEVPPATVSDIYSLLYIHYTCNKVSQLAQ